MWSPGILHAVLAKIMKVRNVFPVSIRSTLKQLSQNLAALTNYLYSIFKVCCISHLTFHCDLFQTVNFQRTSCLLWTSQEVFKSITIKKKLNS